MRSIRYNPFRPVKNLALGSLIDDVAGRSISEFLGSNFENNTPSVNVVEHDLSFDIMVAAPGLLKENFEVDLDNDRLTISSKVDNSKEESTGKITRREFNYSTFKRSFLVSEDISRESISAKYQEGILTVTLPKKEPAEEVKTTIEIS